MSEYITANNRKSASQAKADELRECDHSLDKKALEDFKNLLPSDHTVSHAVDFFKAFGDITRVRILCVLWEHELCVCDISSVLGMSQSAISHQLRFLKQAKLIKSRREGKSVFYSLADQHVQSIINCAFEHINE